MKLMENTTYPKEYKCTNYVNAGVLLFKQSNISISILNHWAKTINKILYKMIRQFPREEGSLNCFILYKYNKHTKLLPTFTKINIDWLYRDISFIYNI